MKCLKGIQTKRHELHYFERHSVNINHMNGSQLDSRYLFCRKTVLDFIKNQRNCFGVYDNNRFSVSFSELIRYLDFLNIILNRYKDASEVLARHLKSYKEPSVGFCEFTTDMDDWNKNCRTLQNNTALEIESYYLFSKILLDKVAHSIELYFSPARGESLNSHDLMCKNIVSYVKSKGLTFPENILDEAKILKNLISDTRDYKFEHLKYPRINRYVQINENGSAVLVFNNLYPKDTDKITKTVDLNILSSDLYKYIKFNN